MRSTSAHTPPPTELPERRRAQFTVIDGAGVHRPTRWRLALEQLEQESIVIGVAASKMARGQALEQPDLDRLQVARLRVRDALEVLRG